MDLKEIQQIVEKDKGKFIIVENGRPVMVIISFQDYKDKIGNSKPKIEAAPPELDEEELKIEDLPF